MKENAKVAIIDAAIYLFNHKGFNGTSVRDIASKAKTNVANISYYFGNKNGLLEQCLTEYYEAYIQEIEKGFNLLDRGSTHSLKAVAENILYFQFENVQLTRLIIREMSIDSQMVREIMSTYLTKEKYYLNRIFEQGFKTKEFYLNTTAYLILQWKSLLTMPFLNTHYLTEVLYLVPHETYFVEKYVRETHAWIDHVVCRKEPKEQQVTLLNVL
ncbi:forespore capture DNA-binding protein RefZ [Cytobacillus kochii]|uniref:forespore capture DNA-binding protein RefZ n=1 Tax=Cytobacillus kochii TaxID=859143 RepID=UPI001CD3C339|nr:forespore capture DNA-binding protein RefZ [Cytobacillus kochii]MCA1025159.1 forespore capture DNA-binding protein RefZ [Cytobacillus kochii]MDM5208798.1 forespore capture DNA-binding protein RefZ [Cytobacillus kochii]